MTAVCSTCRDTGFVREVFDAGYCFASATEHDRGARECPDCLTCWCDAQGIKPHPEDFVIHCPKCDRLALQRFDARVVYADEQDRPTPYTQRTCGACGNTYACEKGSPYPEGSDHLLLSVLERRDESEAA